MPKPAPSILDVSPRAYACPTVVRVNVAAKGSPESIRYAVAGTDYGWLHTTGGDIRTWGSYSGARRVALEYMGR